MSVEDVPQGWAPTRISDVIAPVDVVDPQRMLELEFTYIDIGAVHAESGAVATRKRLPVAEAPSRARQAVRGGDVLFSTVRPYLRAIGRVPAMETAVASTGFCVLRAAPGVDPRFLFHLVRSDAFVESVLPFQRGSSYPAVRDLDVVDRALLLPPSAEQVRIADKLDELFGDLDAAMAELRAAQAKLNHYRQSLLKAAVEGNLTAKWRASNPPKETGAELLARILRERRARQSERLNNRRAYSAPVSIETAELGALPQGWTCASIDELAEVGTGVTPLRTDSRYFDGGTVPWVTSGALNAERVLESSSLVTETALEECRLVLYPAGSLLVAMYGEGKTRGKCAELGIDATINQAIAALVFHGAAFMCREYVKAFLWHSYERMRQQASGGVQPNLNLQIIKALAVPLPPLAEQEAIVLALNAQLQAVREHEAAIARGLRMAAAQRQNILRAAFAGQLVPQDPNDEPASVLLERIRAERAPQTAVPKTRRPRADKVNT